MSKNTTAAAAFDTLEHDDVGYPGHTHGRPYVETGKRLLRRTFRAYFFPGSGFESDPGVLAPLPSPSLAASTPLPLTFAMSPWRFNDLPC